MNPIGAEGESKRVDDSRHDRASKPTGRRLAIRFLDAVLSPLLDVVLTKPIAVFVWWLSAIANRTTFRRRGILAARVREARRRGRPILFASNHLSLFDDPVVPMSLFRTGQRAAAELAVLVVLVLACFVTRTSGVRWATAAYFAAIALFGVRKAWWSLGDVVNFSGAALLRAKLEAGRTEPLPRLQRALIAAADPAIYYFMRSATVKTIFVDRREGDDAKRMRARAIERTVEVTSHGDAAWVFFEGGRSRDPDLIAPARAGIGHVALGLASRGLRPLLIAVHHRGLEKVMPIGGRRWLTTGHAIDVDWDVIDVEHAAAARSPMTAQEIADEVRDSVCRLQDNCRRAHGEHGA
jgi:1-acyl-sn-glycerol-3-phosphate acyltransferase